MMAISVGFFKYVSKWVTDQQTAKVMYRPFEADENPYKASVFIVGSHPTPLLELPDDCTQTYANALVDRNEFHQLFPDYLSSTSRDVKGAIRFSNALKEQGIVSSISYVNALTAMNLTQLKKQKQENAEQFKRGVEIFKEVIEEFKPPAILLHGTYALEQFRQNFSGYFIEFGHPSRSVSELEDEGMFGKIIHDNGKETLLFACKSLSYFKESSESFATLIEQLKHTKNSLFS
jgi:hypothetical protein